MTILGILSDTHLIALDDDFKNRVERAFGDCEVIVHAGDLTDASILEAFAGKELYAVHGNMCNPATSKSLPEHCRFTLDGYTIGLSHGAGERHNIEERMLALFPTADCIIYGHTHSPVCHSIGATLLINPGSFQSTGRYGAQGSYAIMKLGSDGLQASLHQLSWAP